MVTMFDDLIEVVEMKIKGCEELGGMEKEIWAFKQTLKLLKESKLKEVSEERSEEIIPSNDEVAVFNQTIELDQKGLDIWKRRLGFPDNRIVERIDIFVKRCMLLMFMWNKGVNLSPGSKLSIERALYRKYSYLLKLRGKKDGK